MKETKVFNQKFKVLIAVAIQFVKLIWFANIPENN